MESTYFTGLAWGVTFDLWLVIRNSYRVTGGVGGGGGGSVVQVRVWVRVQVLVQVSVQVQVQVQVRLGDNRFPKQNHRA